MYFAESAVPISSGTLPPGPGGPSINPPTVPGLGPGIGPGPGPWPDTPGPDAPGPDPEESTEGLHTGTEDDPIPINWYKRPQDYPLEISLLIDGARRTVPMYSELRIRRLRGDRRLVTIGVAERNRISTGTMLRRGTTSPRTGQPQRLFREIMEDRDYRGLTGKQADHVMDLQFGGADELRNIWPLREDINQRPIPPRLGGEDWNRRYIIRFINSQGLVEERPIGQMHGFWFLIDGFRYPPVPNPGGMD